MARQKKKKTISKSIRVGKTRVSGRITKSKGSKSKRKLSGSVRVGKTRVSGQISKSKRGRSGKIRASAKTTRSARGKQKITSSVRAGGRVISLQAAPVKADRKPSKDSKNGLRMSRGSVKKNASQLVDIATDLLKTGVEFTTEVGIQSGLKGKKVLKEQANTLVTDTTRRLNKAVKEGSRLAHKGIEKL